MKVLITGINGFVGSFLAESLLKDGHEVYGTTQPGTSNECLGDICGDLKLIETEMTDPESVQSAVKKSRPERIFHLAGQSHVPTSWSDPTGTYRVNVEGTMNLVEIASRMRKVPRILLVSSGDVYGRPTGGKNVFRENSPLSPLNPYAASKASAEMFALSMCAASVAPIVIVRPFNHIGPKQSPVFVASDFAMQIAEIEAGRRKPLIKVGDLSAQKDFTDVRDMVNAYKLGIEKCPPGEIFNICSGKTHSISELLDTLLKISGTNAKIVQEKKRLRATASTDFKADARKFKRITAWKPLISFKNTLKDILDYWRSRIN